ncbi:MAG: DUF1648 domain-containing protein [Alicyclobacillus sp.]|nr:DUF1648 domain-containing protein [Alicyclobacillus sp.]
MSSTRPHIVPPNRWWDYVFITAGATIVLVNIIYTCYVWMLLPNTIPTHFSVSGQPNQWGGKGNVIPLPIISLLLYALFIVFRRFPWLMNYPVAVTPHNAIRLYSYARLLMAIMALESSAFLFASQLGIVRTALGKQHGLGSIYLILVVVISLLVLIVFLVAMISRSKRETVD